MEKTNERGVLESLLFAAGDEGLSIKQICTTMDITEEETNELLNKLQAEYDNDPNRGITLTALAGTFQLATKREFADFLKKLVESPGPSTLQAGLESLVIVAYKQPITRIEIEEIRGVKTERPLATLMARGLIKEVGRAEGSGRARLYGTTKEFLDYFGLKDLKDLPSISEHSDEESGVQDDADLFFSSFKEQVGE